MEHMPHSSNLYPLCINFYHINAFYVLYLDTVLMTFYVSKEKLDAVSRETLSLWKQQSQISLWPGWTQSIINFNGTTLSSWHYSNTCEKHSLVVLKINTHVVSGVSFVLFSIQTAPIRAALMNFSTSFYQNEIRVQECSAEVPEPPTSSTATEFQALSDWTTLTAVHSGTFLASYSFVSWTLNWWWIELKPVTPLTAAPFCIPKLRESQGLQAKKQNAGKR